MKLKLKIFAVCFLLGYDLKIIIFFRRRNEMKLAYRAYAVTLLLLTLVFAAAAQTPNVSGSSTVTYDKNARSAKDNRNTAPTDGTGGPVGGPSALFTVYGGETLRKGK